MGAPARRRRDVKRDPMRDIFEDIFQSEPIDPVEAARRHMRAPVLRRFYSEVCVAEEEGGFSLLLDRKPVKTPARRALAAPTHALAEALAAEWRAQGEHVEPAKMPLTRLANSIIDGVADRPDAVAAAAEEYLATDLVFYRAADPEGLVTRQALAWDPLINWAREALGADFVRTEALAFVVQPEATLAAARAAIPRDPWPLGALHSITTLTGSALIALAVLHGRLSVEEAWAAAHVDEDWNMEFWGRDELALQRRAFRFAEMAAAATVLASLSD
jgi:chaperone required for assembly of F1-ATPase